MEVSKDVRRIANRHAARLLSKIEQVHKLSDLAVEAVQKEMHYLAEDVVERVEEEISMEDGGEVNGNR